MTEPVRPLHSEYIFVFWVRGLVVSWPRMEPEPTPYSSTCMIIQKHNSSRIKHELRIWIMNASPCFNHGITRNIIEVWNICVDWGCLSPGRLHLLTTSVNSRCGWGQMCMCYIRHHHYNRWLVDCEISYESFFPSPTSVVSSAHHGIQLQPMPCGQNAVWDPQSAHAKNRTHPAGVASRKKEEYLEEKEAQNNADVVFNLFVPYLDGFII